MYNLNSDKLRYINNSNKLRLPRKFYIFCPATIEFSYSYRVLIKHNSIMF